MKHQIFCPVCMSENMHREETRYASWDADTQRWKLDLNQTRVVFKCYRCKSTFTTQSFKEIK